MLGLGNCSARTAEEDEGVVGVLKNGTRSTREKRVRDAIRDGRVLEQTSQDIGDDDEEIGRQRVTLTEAGFTVNPTTRNTNKEDRSLPRGKEVMDPSSPFGRKTSAVKDAIKTFLAHTVKGFVEIQLEDNGRGVSLIAAVKKVSCIGEVIGNAPTKNKTRLICTDQGRDERLESVSEGFEDTFDSAILESNGSEVLRLASGLFFWEKDKVRSVEPLNIRRMRVKGIKETDNVCRD